MTPEQLRHLKITLREDDIPFFEDDILEFYFKLNNGDINATIYHCLQVKAENTQMNISGLSVQDTGRYFRRLSQRYRPNNSRCLNA